MRDDQKLGPVGTERLLQLHASGLIDGTALVWRYDRNPASSAWQPLRVALRGRARSEVLRAGLASSPADGSSNDVVAVR
ncbi:hypothetical protein [Pseudorhodoferax soli]|uniref:hypothetical protein n=1 Tax=Pseudorhodoferax soli TaxID=545864 RepID=UPI003CCC817F